jgi:N-acetylmuramoyl-L-alanine amidase
MGRIFLSAGHGGFENGVRDPGVVAGGTTEAQEMISIRDLVGAELRSLNFQVYVVPDDLSQVETIDWINSYSRSGDVA